MSFKKHLYVLLFILAFNSQAFATEPITTSGNQVLIGGQPGSLAGNSFFWSNFGGDAYYNRAVVSWLKEDWNTTFVRAAMGVEEFNGFLSNPTLNRNAVKAVVDAAIAEDIYVIIDWHTHDAESNTTAAVDFFTEMAQLYGDHDNVIFEIYNEPIGDFNNSEATWNSIKNYAAPVIAAIRDHSDNLIIVGTPFFSQRVDTASENPITGVENLAYTLHFYAGTHGQNLRDVAQTALDNGIPLFVTEWGTVNADGDGNVDETSTQEWMTFLEERNISHLNWAVNDKDEGASVLIGTEQGENNQGNWTLDLLTSSGLLVREIIRDWPQAIDTATDPESNPEPSEQVIIHQTDYEAEPATGFGFMPATIGFANAGGDLIGFSAIGNTLTSGDALGVSDANPNSGSLHFVIDTGATTNAGSGYGSGWSGQDSNSGSGGFLPQAEAIASGEGCYVDYSVGATFTVSVMFATDAENPLRRGGSPHVRLEFSAGETNDVRPRVFSSALSHTTISTEYQLVTLSYTLTAADVALGIDNVFGVVGSDGHGFGATDGLIYVDDYEFSVNSENVVFVGDVHGEDGGTCGDVNLDGTVDFLDILPFIDLLASGGYQSEADCDMNGIVNFLDISPFILVLSGQ